MEYGTPAEQVVITVIELSVWTFIIWILAIFIVSRHKMRQRAAEEKRRRRYDGTWT